MSQQLKTWLLPLAMLAGGIGYSFFSRFVFLIPYLIFAMLLITYCRLSFREIRFRPVFLLLFSLQITVGLFFWYVVHFFNPVIAEGGLMCIFAPTAMAAAVITGMLGGNLAFAATYTLFSNLGIALIAPILFSFIGTHSDLPFFESLKQICVQLLPLLLLPLLLAVFMERCLSRIYQKIKAVQSLTFYIWTLSLLIISGRTVSFILEQDNTHYGEEIALALIALVICIVQFLAGRYIGKRSGEIIAAGQSFGQKNTVLAIWMTQVYLHPLASIAPAAYVLWQNGINSFQLWRHARSIYPHNVPGKE